MATGGHLLDSRRSSLINQITSVDPVLDKLLERGLITDEQYDLIRQVETRPEKVRQLLDLVRFWGDCYKDEVWCFLQDENPCSAVFTEKRPPDLTTARRTPKKLMRTSRAPPALVQEQNSHAVHKCGDTLVIGSPAAFPSAARQRNAPNTVEQYGNIMEVECTGASSFTARRNGLIEAGKHASFQIAKEDAAKLPQYKDVIVKVARAKNLDPALIAAIISRETRFGDLLRNGWGHDKECFGLMQISKLHHDEIFGDWDSEEHISQAAGILVDMIEAMQRKFREWRSACQLKGGIAAYNCGPADVLDYDGIDKATVGKDYANDVAARAQWFKTNCFPSA